MPRYEVPQALAEIPFLEDHQEALYRGWRVLSIGRGMTVGATRAFASPLPAGDCLAVAEAYGFEPVPFLLLCRQLDTVYLAHVNR